MARLRLFGPASDAAGTKRDTITGRTVGEVLEAASERYGPRFADVLETSAVWLNGEQANVHALVSEDDEVAVLPPVSGGL